MHKPLLIALIGCCMIPALVNAAPAVERDRTTKVVKAADFGAVPDDGKDDTAAIRAAVEQCVKQPGSRLVFAPGQYDVMSEKGLADWRRMITAATPGKERWRGSPPQGWEGWPKDKNTILRIVGCKDLVIDGHGSTLMVHGLHQPFYLENCRNVTIRNLNIDWKQPPCMTGRVLACEGRHLDVEILDVVPVAGGEPFIALQVYDPVTWLPTALETFAGVQSTELLRPKVLRLNLTDDGRGNIFAGRVPVGNLLAMRHILSGYEPFELKECDGVRIEDVDLYTGPGMGIVGIGSRDIALHRVRIIPKPGTRQIVSTTADATHFINCSGTIELRDCEFSGMGDDHLNVHGQYHFVHKLIDARTIEARIGTLSGFGQWSDCWVWGWASPPIAGDTLEFARHDDLNIFGKAKIESIDYNQQTGRSRIVFTEPQAAKLSQGDILQSTRQVPKLRISGCTFGPNRARGTLITSRDVVIENNTFDRLGGTAIFVCCEVDWLEAPAPANVTIRNNTFADCGYAVANEGGGAVTVLLKQHRNIAGWIKDVVIEGNTVSGTHGAGFRIEQTDGLVVRNNTFEKYNPAITVSRSCNVKIDGNQLTHASQRIVVDPSCDMKTVQRQQLPFRPAIVRVQLDRDKVRQGESLQMTLEFRGNAATERDFRPIVELFPLGRPPDFATTLSPKQPSSGWPPGEVVSEGPFEITIPRNIGPGWRRVLLGLVEPAAGGARLPLDNGDRHERQFRYYFGEIEILPADSTTRGKPVVWLPVSDPAKPEGGTEEWRMRHAERVADVRSKADQLDLLFIGDSITGGWMNTGKSVWDKEYAPSNAVNIGIAGSQTQHVLWQFDHGAIDGISPRVAVVMIGVNNILGSPSHSAQDITRGIHAIVRRLREKLPGTKILLLGTFPADRDPMGANRRKIRRINAMIVKLDDGQTVRFLDISDALLNPDGTFSPEVSPDAIHLTPKGYQIWADAMRPLLRAMLKDTAGGETPKPLETFELSNEKLQVRMMADRPGVAGYEHLATGEKLAAATAWGVLLINDQPVPWKRWNVKVDRNLEGGRVVYCMSLPEDDISFDCTFALKDNMLEMELANVVDPNKKLTAVGFRDLPLLACTDGNYHFWRERWGQSSFTQKFGGQWGFSVQGGKIGSQAPDGGPVPAIHGCLFKPNTLCAFVYSNYPLLPLRNRIAADATSLTGKRYSIGLNRYRYRTGSRTNVPLRVQVVFEQDFNRDGDIDEMDYKIWLNRHLPEPDPIYKTHLWYKIFTGDGWREFGSTTFVEADKILQYIFNATDGLPQICYLGAPVYQEDDGDKRLLLSLLGFINAANPGLKPEHRPGTKAELLRLFETAKEKYNTILSFHMNVDEEFFDPNSPLLARGPGEESGVYWAVVDMEPITTGIGPGKIWYQLGGATAWHISHFKQVESGDVFKRLERILKVFPFEKTIHLDAMRNTNCNPRWEPDGIGMEEETFGGLIPIIDYLKDRGISVTTEGINGMNLELAGIYSGLWHYGADWAIYHGKMLLGGRRGGNNGLGRSFNEDLCWRKVRYNGFLDVETNWAGILDRIYLGGLLYHYYCEKTILDINGSTFIYADGTVANVGPGEQLKVSCGDLIVAWDNDRFIPRGDAIYAYSRDGSRRDWVLPEKFRGKPLESFTLSKEGRGPAPEYQLEKDRIRLKLLPRVPVKIQIAR